MKHFPLNLVLTACALHDSGAFTFPSQPPPKAPSSSLAIVTSCNKYLANSVRTPLRAATVGSSDSRQESPPSNRKSHPRTPTINEQLELKIIRKELIQKYIALGHSEDYATREVDYFLEDSERSAQYMEMRRIAMARGDDLGFESLVQFGGAFLIGLLGSWMMDSWHTYQAANPNGGLPWVS